jgi:hypothetical protein
MVVERGEGDKEYVEEEERAFEPEPEEPEVRSKLAAEKGQ